MAPVTITISEEAHELLLAHQQRGESVSDVIQRVLPRTVDPLESAGTYPGLGAAVESAKERMNDEFSEGPES